jgi:hypothetical protein
VENESPACCPHAPIVHHDIAWHLTMSDEVVAPHRPSLPPPPPALSI